MVPFPVEWGHTDQTDVGVGRIGVVRGPEQRRNAVPEQAVHHQLQIVVGHVSLLIFPGGFGIFR